MLYFTLHCYFSSDVSATELDGEWIYEYDLTGQLTGAVFASTNPDIESQDLTYIYDAAGNRTQTIVNGVRENYSTNNLNQYQSAGTTTYSYDLDDNLTSKTEGNQTWTYSHVVLMLVTTKLFMILTLLV